MSSDQPLPETELALLRQSVNTLTTTVNEMRKEMKDNATVFATKAEVTKLELQLRSEINAVRNSFWGAVRWVGGIATVVIGAVVVAALSIKQ